MAALLAWLGRRPEVRLGEGRFAAALARLAEHGPAGCSRVSLPGFELALLKAGTPSEALAGPPRVQGAAPALAGALIGWLWETEATVRTLGLPSPPTDQTELLLAAVARRAQAGLLALEGAFAALVYDPRAHEVLLRTDLAGQRALYLCAVEEGCWISSDEAALVAQPGLASVEPLHVARLLCALAPPADAGWFRGVKQVGAGQLWRVDGQGAHCLLQSGLPERAVPRQRAAVVEAFRALQAQAVRRCCAGIPAGTLGLSMSGGLDSLGVAAHVRAQSMPLMGLSWTLQQTPDSDESAAIATAAQALKLPLQAFAADALTPLGGAPRRVARGELLSNLYREIKQRLYGEARSHGIRVLLNGAGGDQLYGTARGWLTETLARGHLGAALAELGWRMAHGTMPWRDPAVRQVGRVLLGRPPPDPGLLAGLHPAWQQAVRAAGLPPPTRRILLNGPYAARAAAAEHAHAEVLGLELRSPWRDPDLMAFALSLSPHLLARRGQRKWLGRAALAGCLPEPQRLAAKRGDLSFFLREALAGPVRARWQTLLTSAHAAWPDYVQPAAIHAALAHPALCSEAALLGLWLCVALEHWREACQRRSA